MAAAAANTPTHLFILKSQHRWRTCRVCFPNAVENCDRASIRVSRNSCISDQHIEPILDDATHVEREFLRPLPLQKDFRREGMSYICKGRSAIVRKGRCSL
jgi:hypothetical protein